DLLSALRDELRAEGRRLAGGELSGQRPVLLGDERLDLTLTLDDDPHRDALDATGRETAAHLVPEQRADLVADEAVEDPARLLGVDLVPVDLARVLERVQDRLLRDLVEEDAAEGNLRVLRQLFLEVPADRLALAVGVGSEEDGVRILRGR